MSVFLPMLPRHEHRVQLGVAPEITRRDHGFVAHWFEDRVVADGYATDRPPIHWPILERAVRLLPDGYPRRVGVDVGCGAGGSTAPLVHVVDIAIGIDSSAAMLAAVRATGIDAMFCSAAAEALPFQDKSVDLIVAAGSLDFVDLRAALEEAGRVVAPNGNVLVYDFGAASRCRSSDDLATWYSAFSDRYPPAVDTRQPPTRDVLASHRNALTLRSHEAFDLDLVLSPIEYADYLMTQTNVASAVARGESYDTIRSWCLQTLDGFFVAPRPVVFDGYIAHLTRAKP
jgi:SAM-dependent methyltransferase